MSQTIPTLNEDFMLFQLQSSLPVSAHSQSHCQEPGEIQVTVRTGDNTNDNKYNLPTVYTFLISILCTINSIIPIVY